MTRLRTKSRNARVSGAENAALPPVARTARRRAGPAAAAPAVVVVPVEVGPDRGRAARRLTVLAPGVVAAVLDVVCRPVRVHREDDPDLAVVDDVRDPRRRAVALGQPAQDRERHLEAHVLVGMVEAVEHHLRLGLVGPDVVRDLHRPQIAALVALPDREALDDRRVGVGRGLHLGGHLRVRVERLLAGREVRIGCRRGCRAERGQQCRDEGRAGDGCGGSTGAAAGPVHGSHDRPSGACCPRAGSPGARRDRRSGPLASRGSAHAGRAAGRTADRSRGRTYRDDAAVARRTGA